VGLLIVTLGHSTVFAQAADPPTLFSFMGIPKGVNKIKDNLLNRRGNFPCLERKPKLKALADAANLESEVPAIKAAAEIKAAEDLAPQKIKAIKYLAKLGCGPYDKDGKVTEALLAAMDDPTEDVRLAAVEAIGTTAKKEMDVQCKQKSCCSEDVVNKLAKIAYELDENGCYLEPSEKVREAAIRSVCQCCPGRESFDEIIEEREVPVEEGQEVPDTVEPAEPVPETDETASRPTAVRNLDQTARDGPAPVVVAAERPQGADQHRVGNLAGNVKLGELFSHRGDEPVGSTTDRAPAEPVRFAHGPTGRTAAEPIADTRPLRGPDRKLFSFASMPRSGTVDHVDLAEGTAQVGFETDHELRLGARLKVYHEYFFTGKYAVGELEVVASSPGCAIVRPVGWTQLEKIARGDEALVVHPGG